MGSKVPRAPDGYSPEPLGKGIPERECGVELLPDDCFVSTRRVTSVTLANR